MNPERRLHCLNQAHDFCLQNGIRQCRTSEKKHIRQSNLCNGEKLSQWQGGDIGLQGTVTNIYNRTFKFDLSKFECECGAPSLMKEPCKELIWALDHQRQQDLQGQLNHVHQVCFPAHLRLQTWRNQYSEADMDLSRSCDLEGVTFQVSAVFSYHELTPEL